MPYSWPTMCLLPPEYPHNCFSCFSLTNERRWDTQTVPPEVGTAVGDGAVAEQVAVAYGVQVRNSALVVPSRAAAPSALTV